MFSFLGRSREPTPQWARYRSPWAREMAKLGGVPSRNELVDLGRTAVCNRKLLEAIALFIDAGQLELIEETLDQYLRSGGLVPDKLKEPYLRAICQLKRLQNAGR